MKKKVLFSITLIIVIVSSISTFAFDYCKNNDSKNDGTCEAQCAGGQVECVTPPIAGVEDCYGHGNEDRYY